MSSFFSFTLLWQASIVTGDNCTFFPHKSEASNVRKRKVRHCCRDPSSCMEWTYCCILSIHTDCLADRLERTLLSI
ncbi:hypothetical protein V6N11_006977 [Hibiscus sabdariffa]|uniref:Secreted protein n=1 Tax=Hibiscus sabdariffa TaxID=183260 RepID=A0ABR2RSL7_9ROSI